VDYFAILSAHQVLQELGPSAGLTALTDSLIMAPSVSNLSHWAEAGEVGASQVTQANLRQVMSRMVCCGTQSAQMASIISGAAFARPNAQKI